MAPNRQIPKEAGTVCSLEIFILLARRQGSTTFFQQWAHLHNFHAWLAINTTPTASNRWTMACLELKICPIACLRNKRWGPKHIRYIRILHVSCHDEKQLRLQSQKDQNASRRLLSLYTKPESAGNGQFHSHMIWKEFISHIFKVYLISRRWSGIVA